jgi:hypothetical protein
MVVIGRTPVNNELIIIAIAVVALIAVAAWAYSVRASRERLRTRFGPEYDRTLEAVGTPAKADAVLRERAVRVSRFKLHPLSVDQADRFRREWRQIQATFVDNPDEAVRESDRLVTEVMAARGYPAEDFDTRAADLSVDHPTVVENYRVARGLAQRRAQGHAGTEELRQAVVNYRALFDDLLETGEVSQRRAS